MSAMRSRIAGRILRKFGRWEARPYRPRRALPTWVLHAAVLLAGGALVGLATLEAPPLWSLVFWFFVTPFVAAGLLAVKVFDWLVN